MITISNILVLTRHSILFIYRRKGGEPLSVDCRKTMKERYHLLPNTKCTRSDEMIFFFPSWDRSSDVCVPVWLKVRWVKEGRGKKVRDKKGWWKGGGEG